MEKANTQALRRGTLLATWPLTKSSTLGSPTRPVAELRFEKAQNLASMNAPEVIESRRASCNGIGMSMKAMQKASRFEGEVSKGQELPAVLLRPVTLSVCVSTLLEREARIRVFGDSHYWQVIQTDQLWIACQDKRSPWIGTYKHYDSRFWGIFKYRFYAKALRVRTSSRFPPGLPLSNKQYFIHTYARQARNGACSSTLFSF